MLSSIVNRGLFVFVILFTSGSYANNCKDLFSYLDNSSWQTNQAVKVNVSISGFMGRQNLLSTAKEKLMKKLLPGYQGLAELLFTAKKENLTVEIPSIGFLNSSKKGKVTDIQEREGHLSFRLNGRQVLATPNTNVMLVKRNAASKKESKRSKIPDYLESKFAEIIKLKEIGVSVEVRVPGFLNNIIRGKVNGIRVSGGKVFFRVGNTEMDLSSSPQLRTNKKLRGPSAIKPVIDPSLEGVFGRLSQALGRKIPIEIEASSPADKPISGKVTNLFYEEGLLYYELNNGKIHLAHKGTRFVYQNSAKEQQDILQYVKPQDAFVAQKLIYFQKIGLPVTITETGFQKRTRFGQIKDVKVENGVLAFKLSGKEIIANSTMEIRPVFKTDNPRLLLASAVAPPLKPMVKALLELQLSKVTVRAKKVGFEVEPVGAITRLRTDSEGNLMFNINDKVIYADFNLVLDILKN